MSITKQCWRFIDILSFNLHISRIRCQRLVKSKQIVSALYNIFDLKVTLLLKQILSDSIIIR